MNAPAPEKNLRVLVVDDNCAIHDDFRKILAAPHLESSAPIEALLFGEPAEAPLVSRTFQLETASQGKDAYEMVRQARAAGRPYAMAFMDVRMPPGWDGIETTSRIWEIDPDLQVVICTAFSDYSWEQIAQKLGQSDQLLILKKPFDPVEVLQLAAALTEKWSLLQRVNRQMDRLEDTVGQKTDELRKSEERYRLIAENAGDLVSIVDLQGLPLYRSPSYERLLGYSHQALAALDTLDLVAPDDRDAFIAVTQTCLREGTTQIRDFHLRRQDGHWLTVEAHCGPFRNTAGLIEGALIVARDVTERRKLELQLRQAQKLESVGQLATGIAHEINTPTQFIGDNLCFLRDAFADFRLLLTPYDKLYCAARDGLVTPELLNEVAAARVAANADYLTAEIPRAIDDTLNGVARTTKIVKAMRNFAHPGSSEKTAINLSETIEDALALSRNEWRYVADATAEIEPNLPPLPVYPGEFSQVLLNLLVNASHAIADVVGDGRAGKGTIVISATRSGDWVELRVRDTGTGIPEKARDRVFDPFFTTKPVGKGTGQGLAIARSIIVNKHGGSIAFETKIGLGTVFIIRLPLSSSSVVDRIKPQGQAA